MDYNRDWRRYVHGPRRLSEEKHFFEAWMTGKEVQWIGESLEVPQAKALEWGTEWERGIQQKWQPHIPGLE